MLSMLNHDSVASTSCKYALMLSNQPPLLKLSSFLFSLDYYQLLNS